MAVNIRPATSQDASAIHGLILELAEYEKMLDEASRGSNVENLVLHLEGEDGPPLVGFVAEEAGMVCGFALCYLAYSTFHTNWGMYLEDLYVQPSARGQGIGLALMRAVAGEAIRRDCVRLEWQVLTWNDLAIDFYNRLGARSMDDWSTMRLTGSSLHALARPAAE